MECLTVMMLEAIDILFFFTMVAGLIMELLYFNKCSVRFWLDKAISQINKITT